MQLGQTVELLTQPQYSIHWEKMQELWETPAPWAFDSLCTYVREIMRLSPPVAPVLRKSDVLPGITDWRYSQGIKKGEMLLLDVAAASRDPGWFSEPDNISLDRSRDAYLPFYDGPFATLVSEIVVIVLSAQLRIIAKLKGLRRAPGHEEGLRKKCQDGYVSYLNEARDRWLPLPFSKSIAAVNLDLVS